MARLFISFVLLASLCKICVCVTVNEDCKALLTKLDSHMIAYVGYIEELVAVHESKDTYRYKIGICTDVDDEHPGCAIMQYEQQDGGGRSFCSGIVNTAQIARSKDGVWIELTYSGGDNYTSHCDKRSRMTRLAFLCDANIAGKGKVEFLGNNVDQLCYYLFTIVGRAVCGYQLSPGDIICIIFASLLGLWLVAMILGLLYKRFLLGAKGWEQIPLIDWYREFGNLQADGCTLVCRSKLRRIEEYKEPTYIWW